MNKYRTLYHFAANQDLSAFDEALLEILFETNCAEVVEKIIEETKSRAVQDFALSKLELLRGVLICQTPAHESKN